MNQYCQVYAGSTGLSHTDFVHLFWPHSQSHLPILWQAGFIKIPFGYCGLSWDCPKVSWAQGKGISGRLYIREVSVHSIWDPEVCLFCSFNPATHPLIRSWQVSLSWNVSAGFATSAWDSAPFVSRQNAWIKTRASHSRVVRTGALRRGDRGRNSLLSHVLLFRLTLMQEARRFFFLFFPLRNKEGGKDDLQFYSFIFSFFLSPSSPSLQGSDSYTQRTVYCIFTLDSQHYAHDLGSVSFIMPS